MISFFYSPSHCRQLPPLAPSEENLRILSYISLNDQIALFRKLKIELDLFLPLVEKADPRALTDIFREWVTRPLARMQGGTESGKFGNIAESFTRMLEFPVMRILPESDSKKLATEIDNILQAHVGLFFSSFVAFPGSTNSFLLSERRVSIPINLPRLVFEPPERRQEVVSKRSHSTLLSAGNSFAFLH